MHPILFRWGDLALHTYGAFAAIGFLAGLGLAGRQGRRAGLGGSAVGDAGAALLLGGLLGARLFYVLFHLSEFQEAMEVVKIWRGGLMWQGGLLGGTLAGVLHFRRRGISLAMAADVLAPGIALGQAFGRVGCFFAGCCHGAACAKPWAVTFRSPESLAPIGVPLHPTQLYDAGFNVLIAFLLVWISDRPAFRAGRGRVAWLYLTLASAARLAVEPFRADARGAGIGDWSATALIAAGFFAVGLASLLISRRSAR